MSETCHHLWRTKLGNQRVDRMPPDGLWVRFPRPQQAQSAMPPCPLALCDARHSLYHNMCIPRLSPRDHQDSTLSFRHHHYNHLLTQDRNARCHTTEPRSPRYLSHNTVSPKSLRLPMAVLPIITLLDHPWHTM